MKSENITFSPSTSGVVLVLNDSSIQVTQVVLQCAKLISATSSESSGFDDGINPHAKYAFSDGSLKSSDRTAGASIWMKKNVSGSLTDAVKGKVDGAKFSSVGEIEFSFTASDAGYVIDGVAYGN